MRPGRCGVAMIKVMTRNLYLGASIEPILAATSLADIPHRMAAAWSMACATRPDERALALAAEIDRIQPHLVGLQEAWMLHSAAPAPAPQSKDPDAPEMPLDLLSALLRGLERRQQAYSVVAASTASDFRLPSATGHEIRARDSDVVLARSDIAITNPRATSLDIKANIRLGGPSGPPVTIVRTWTSVDADVGGQALRFVSTHLETGDFPEIQIAQASELVRNLADCPLPVVLVGDFNFEPGDRTAAYRVLSDAGFEDVWQLANPLDAGPTCCHAEDLRESALDLGDRIDLILIRDGAGASIEAVAAERVGCDPELRTSSGLWPSDHAGVAATLHIGPR